jgi:DNA-binding transcriptional LysR family regulator
MPQHDAHWFIRARLKPRQLLLLVSIEELGNIHKAAEALGMSQPAASKLLKELEDALDVPLFDRLARGMRATAYGEIMIRHARMTLSTLGIAYQEIGALKTGLVGQVAIGIIMPPGAMLLPMTIAEIKQQYPLLQIRVELDSSDVLVARLLEGNLDMAIARLFEHHDKSAFNFQRLGEESMCLISRQGHPLLRKRKLALADLVSASWVIPTGKVLRHRFEMMFRDQGLAPPSNLVETPAVLIMTSLLQQTDMIAVLSLEAGRHYREHGMVSLLPIELPLKMDAYGIITRHGHLLSPGAALMLQAIRTTAARIYR